MVMMDGQYPEDILRQLWHRIDTLHLSYLETEESPEKLETRMKLENCIRDFLCLASPDQKFYNPETMEVLYRSASSKPDFSGYKAATGFNTIQLYAGNILSQPWRKEYHKIRVYSGFYKHHIEANLVSAELLFKAMGYRYIGSGILMLEGPVCPDKATAVSRDCLVAYVECQILKTIWEELSPSFDITWLDVLEFRKKYIFSPERTVRSLKYQFNQKKYQELVTNGYPETDLDCVHPHSHPKAVVPTEPYYPSNYGHQTYNGMNTIYQRQPYDMNACTNMINSPMPSTNYTYPIPVAQQIVPDYYNRYCCSDPYVASKQCPMHSYPPYTVVPTADLIKFNTLNGTSDYPENANHLKLVRESSDSNIPSDSYTKKATEETHTDSADNAEKKSHFEEDWDYVYRNLASQGYTKDLGERGNILSSAENLKLAQNPQAGTSLYVNHKDLMNHSEVDGGPTVKHSQSEKNAKMSKQLKSIQTDNINFNNMNKSIPSKVSSIKNKSSQLKKNIIDDPPSTKPQNRNIDDGRMKENACTTDNQKKKDDKNKWECKTCTFLNDNGKEVCEMCSKSRSVVIQPIEIGGTQCSKCTLVNPKDRKTCHACDSSLKDSPTYI